MCRTACRLEPPEAGQEVGGLFGRVTAGCGAVDVEVRAHEDDVRCQIVEPGAVAALDVFDDRHARGVRAGQRDQGDPEVLQSGLHPVWQVGEGGGRAGDHGAAECVVEHDRLAAVDAHAPLVGELAAGAVYGVLPSHTLRT
jgi:hypothetical protein